MQSRHSAKKCQECGALFPPPSLPALSFLTLLGRDGARGGFCSTLWVLQDCLRWSPAPAAFRVWAASGVCVRFESRIPSPFPSLSSVLFFRCHVSDQIGLGKREEKALISNRRMRTRGCTSSGDEATCILPLKSFRGRNFCLLPKLICKRCWSAAWKWF